MRHILLVLLVGAVLSAPAVATEEDLGFFIEGHLLLGAELGAWPGGLDGYDRQGDEVTIPDPGYAIAVYHNEPDWTGPRGFYTSDVRSPLHPGETKTWDNIYLWEIPAASLTSFTIWFRPIYTPPTYWTYTLYLDYAPPAANWTGPWQWAISPTQNTTLVFPAVKSQTGLEGYRFHFTVAAVPEPSSLLALAGGLTLLHLRRKRR